MSNTILITMTVSTHHWNDCYRFDEHAKYDLPAMIDYVLQETKEEKLVYIGNSMGTIMGFAAFSTQPLK